MDRLVESVIPADLLDRFLREAPRSRSDAASAAPPSVIAAIRYRMICRSTGPPGTKCVITNTASVIPMNVGITRRSRRMKYPITCLTELPGCDGRRLLLDPVLPIVDLSGPNRELC